LRVVQALRQAVPGRQAAVGRWQAVCRQCEKGGQAGLHKAVVVPGRWWQCSVAGQCGRQAVAAVDWCVRGAANRVRRQCAGGACSVCVVVVGSGGGGVGRQQGRRGSACRRARRQRVANGVAARQVRAKGIWEEWCGSGSGAAAGRRWYRREAEGRRAARRKRCAVCWRRHRRASTPECRARRVQGGACVPLRPNPVV